MSLVVTVSVGVGFLASLVVRKIRRERALKAALPPWDDPRWSSGPSERQVVGMPCGYCTQRFVVQADAKVCKHCNALVHVRRCAKQHRVQEHLGKRDAPYR